VGLETLAPTALEADVNYTGLTIAVIDDDPSLGTSFANWDGNGNPEARVSFPSPSGNLTVGAGLQSFGIGGRKGDSTGGNGPVYDVELWEAGIFVATLTSGATWSDSTSNATISASWNASLLSDISGADVEVRLVQTSGATGSPGNRRAIEISGIDWDVDYSEGSATFKQMNPVVEANIKEVDGIAIASIKSINGVPI